MAMRSWSATRASTVSLESKYRGNPPRSVDLTYRCVRYLVCEVFHTTGCGRSNTAEDFGGPGRAATGRLPWRNDVMRTRTQGVTP